MSARTLALLSALVAGPVAAQATFSPPAGCTGVLTVQHRQCLLYNVWTCEGDPAGHRWSGRFVEGGLNAVRLIDNDSQWLARYFVDPPEVQELQQPSRDPASLTDLLETGVDSYDYTMFANGVFSERTIGIDRLTGREVEIDGEPLLEITFTTADIAEDGSTLSQTDGRQYVSARHRVFVVDEFWPAGRPDEVSSAPPVEFIYPGEPGFFASTPRYDCGVVMSGFRP